MSILTPPLHTSLRTFRLSGMLDTLDTRLTQARAGHLGHLEFLQVLCEDEIARRESAAMNRRIRRARYETQSALEAFDFSAPPLSSSRPRNGVPGLRDRHDSLPLSYA